MLVRMCVEREREREREREKERESERERESVCVCVRVCVHVEELETHSGFYSNQSLEQAISQRKRLGPCLCLFLKQHHYLFGYINRCSVPWHYLALFIVLFFPFLSFLLSRMSKPD